LELKTFENKNHFFSFRCQTKRADQSLAAKSEAESKWMELWKSKYQKYLTKKRRNSKKIAK
jgi:hypothetical protein